MTMDITHDTLVVFAKTFGLFYLIALSVGVLVYVYWPSNRKKFDHAARAILEGEDKPHRVGPCR
jgi:cytochrome c oxidase cbb3-type subunit 4